MKLTVRYVLLAMFLFCFHFTSLISHANPILIGIDDNFPPYSYFIGDKLVGTDVDLLTRAFNMAGVDLELRPVPFKRGVEMARKGTLHGAAPLFWSEDRDRDLYFLRSQPLHFSTFSLFQRAGEMAHVSTVFDLRDKRIAIHRGFTAGEIFRDARLARLFTALEVNNATQMLNLLMTGRVDLIVDNAERMHYWINAKEVHEQVVELPYPLTWRRPAFLTLSRTLPEVERNDLARRLGAALAAIALENPESFTP